MLFPWYIKYPNQNDEILNLDWILSTIDNLVNEVANFVTLNTIKYADPIQWNITTQYEKNTVVIDPISGSAYISTKPVPAGVGLNNTDYWNIIFTLDVISANKNITLRDDANNMLATFESNVDDWLLWQGTLYIVTRDISIGQAYVDNYNISRYTVERFLKEYISNLRTYVDTLAGALNDLNTNDKRNLVAAINEVLTSLTNYATNVDARTGALNDLDTNNKNNLVAAINEVLTSLTNYAINVDARTGALNDLDTSDKSNLVNAINSVLAALTTASTYTNNRINTEVEFKAKIKQYLVVGDSYGDDPTDWAKLVPDYLDIPSTHWHDVVQGGAGFISNGVLTFLAQITNYTGNRNEITDIIVCGGLNDCNNSDISNSWWNNLHNAMNAFNDYAKANYPNATISLGFIGNGRDHEAGSLISTRVYAARQLCKYFYTSNAQELGWKILQNVEYALCTNDINIDSDGVHPSTYGSPILGQAIAEAILTGIADIRYPLYQATNGENKLKYSIVNNQTTLHFSNWWYGVGGGSTISNTLEVQTFSNIYFNHVTELLTIVRLDSFDGLDYQIIPARIQLIGYKMTIELLGTDSSGHFKTNYTANPGGIGAIRIQDNQIVIPTDYLA